VIFCYNPILSSFSIIFFLDGFSYFISGSSYKRKTNFSYMSPEKGLYHYISKKLENYDVVYIFFILSKSLYK